MSPSVLLPSSDSSHIPGMIIDCEQNHRKLRVFSVLGGLMAGRGSFQDVNARSTARIPIVMFEDPATVMFLVVVVVVTIVIVMLIHSSRNPGHPSRDEWHAADLERTRARHDLSTAVRVGRSECAVSAGDRVRHFDP